MSMILELNVDDVHSCKNDYVLVDVREPHELTGPEGQIEGVTLATLGPDLISFLENADPAKSYVFICKSGYRSSRACEIAYSYGIPNVYNMKGGMLAWNERIRTKETP